MSEERAARLERLGMIWSHHDVAWEEGLAAARAGPRNTVICWHRWTPPTRATGSVSG